MVPSRHRWFWVVLCGLIWAAPVASMGQDETAAEPGEVPGELRVVEFRATAFTYRVSGSLLWLAGPDGLLRLEVRRGGGQSALEDMMARRGEGWTAILDGNGRGTLNAWGEPWRQPPPGLATAVRLIDAALSAGNPRPASGDNLWRSESPVTGAQRFPIASLAVGATDAQAGSDFRHRQAARGLGRGGSDEMLELAWQAAKDDTTAWLQVSSSRRPGHLALASRGRLPVIMAVPEAFVPLWPLADLVKITGQP